ncbi:MAG: autotransporter-associated beta strand repeat-containing protein [Chthoniobacter sp.]
MVKNGTNTQVLIGNNTYTGSTTVSGGVLQLGAATTGLNGSNGALASTTITWASAAPWRSTMPARTTATTIA